MLAGEQSGRQSSEANAGSRLEIREHCLVNVQEELTDIQARITAGEPVDYDSNVVGLVIADMAVTAAKSGDLPEAEAQLDSLIRLPEIYDFTLAQACYPVAALGSQRAFNILRGKLEAEKVQATAEVAASRENSPQFLYPYVSAMALDSVIVACEENNVSPDGWIEAYAISKEYKWQWYANHYARGAKAGQPNAVAQQERLDEKATELLEGGDFEPTFLYHNAWYLLRVVKNPDLRSQLLKRYMDITAQISLNPVSFNSHILVGSAVLEDPILATQENVEFFEVTADSCAQVLQDTGMDPFVLMRDQLSWRMTQKRHNGAEPQELIEYLDLHISQMLMSDIPDAPDVLKDWRSVIRNKQFVSDLRDTQLGNFARKSVEEGDFATARLFCASIGSQVVRQYELMECLKKATTQEQIDIIKPDELTLEFDPELAMQFRATEVLVAAKREALAELALELAETIDDGGSSHIKMQYIGRMFAAVNSQDKAQGLILAGELLEKLRATEAKRPDTSQFSDILIAAGDTREPSRRYDDIDQRSLNKSWRLHSLWKLAQALTPKIDQ